MTTPSQPGPGDQNGPGQFGQPGGQNLGGAPSQGFDQPHPQYPGNQGEPPKKKTGLVVGLIALGVLVIGGIVALILVLTNKDDNNSASSNAPSSTDSGSAPASRPNSASSSAGAPSSSPGGSGGRAAPNGQASPQALADFLVNAYNQKNADALQGVNCPSVVDSKKPDLPNDISAQLAGPVTDSSFSFTLSSQGQSATAKATIKTEGGSWCVSGFAQG